MREGALILRGDGTRRAWKLSEPIFLGHAAHHVVLDPRDCRTLLIAARTGHLGPTVFRSADFGKTWKRLDAGLPQRAWFTVKRQAMAADAHEPVGRYFGTTSGELWASRSEGEKWTCLARHLPEIYPVEAAELPR